MKKIIVLLLIVTAGELARGQVMINLQLPPTGLTVKTQLWNFSLINTGTTSINVKMQIILRDASSGQQVLTGTSKIIDLPKGIRQIQYADMMPVTYSINNSSYGIDASPDGFLPVGVFTICFTAIQSINDASDNVAEECETLEIEPISPPMLILPADSEKVDITRPVFNWTPPIPFTLFSNLSYDWLLVEVQSTQTGATALQQNFPLLSQSNLTNTSFQYPLGSPELDTSKLYAWQVTAKNNNNAVGKSEARVFRINKITRDSTVYGQQGYYVKLQKENNASYAICRGTVRYEYLNEINDSTVTLALYDLSSAGNTEIIPENNQPHLVFGENFLQWDLSGVNGISEHHIYLLELRNSKKESWYMKFEYLQPQQ
jgi:hypothetical protein